MCCWRARRRGVGCSVVPRHKQGPVAEGPVGGVGLNVGQRTAHLSVSSTVTVFCHLRPRLPPGCTHSDTQPTTIRAHVPQC
jgi:hypothetical protein